MKMNEFIREKKWQLVSGILFLAAFTIIVGIFVNSMFIKLESVRSQNDSLSSSVKSLEASSAMLESSIDEHMKNTGKNQEFQKLADEMKSDLAEIRAKLAELSNTGNNTADLKSLKAAVDQLNKRLNSMNEGNAPVKPAVKGAKTITDPDIPGNQAPFVKSPSAVIKRGQNITVTVRAGKVSDMYGYQFNLNFDKSKVAYKSGLKSSINVISTIFKKDNADNLLVGATMIGDKKGYSGNDVAVCTMVFTAKEDVDPSTFNIDKVSTVDSSQKYIENISGWSCEAKAG